MAYTINLTNGTIFATIPDGTINTNSSMTLIGKNYAGYGQFLDDNFIHLLENSSNTTAPSNPLVGQLWWDSTNQILNVRNASGWKNLGFLTTSGTAPTNVGYGDLWYDSSLQQLNLYTIGNAWMTVGPAYSSTQGKSGAFGITATDTGSNTRYVTGIYSSGQLVSVVSNNNDFVPATPTELATNFAVVYNGTTVRNGTRVAGNVVNAGNVYISAGNASVANASVVVTSTGANIVGTLAATGNISGANVNTGILNATSSVIGATVSAAGTITGGNLATGGTVSAGGNITGANIITGGLISATSTITAGDTITGGNIATGGTVSATGNVSGGNIIAGTYLSTGYIVHTGTPGVGNIGSASNYFNTVHATATTALYADVAERFAADEALEPGTVVELGGLAEITKSQQELSDNVFGVISTRAAYLMNGGAGTNETHPPVAMTGRVPVRVIGKVSKGDRLVSAGNGLARAARPGEATAFNTIGRCLVDKTTDGVGSVESIVTIK